MRLFPLKSLSSQLSGSLSPHCSLFLVSGSIWISFWRPWGLENTTNSLRESSFSSISKFSLRSPLRKEKMSQKDLQRRPKHSPSRPGAAQERPRVAHEHPRRYQNHPRMIKRKVWPPGSRENEPKSTSKDTQNTTKADLEQPRKGRE